MSAVLIIILKTRGRFDCLEVAIWKTRGRFYCLEVVKNTLGNFHKLLEITVPEDKKTLLQLIISKITIKNKKDIESIESHFDDKVQKYFINNKEEESPDDGVLLLFQFLQLEYSR